MRQSFRAIHSSIYIQCYSTISYASDLRKINPPRKNIPRAVAEKKTRFRHRASRACKYRRQAGNNFAEVRTHARCVHSSGGPCSAKCYPLVCQSFINRASRAVLSQKRHHEGKQERQFHQSPARAVCPLQRKLREIARQ